MLRHICYRFGEAAFVYVHRQSTDAAYRVHFMDALMPPIGSIFMLHLATSSGQVICSHFNWWIMQNLWLCFQIRAIILNVLQKNWPADAPTYTSLVIYENTVKRLLSINGKTNFIYSFLAKLISLFSSLSDFITYTELSVILPSSQPPFCIFFFI